MRVVVAIPGGQGKGNAGEGQVGARVGARVGAKAGARVGARARG